MGIHGLAKLIADHAPIAIKEQDIKNYFGKLLTIIHNLLYTHIYIHTLYISLFSIFYMYASICTAQLCFAFVSRSTRLGRKIAIDASMCIYQFLIAVRQDGNVLQNEDGETTRYCASDTVPQHLSVTRYMDSVLRSLMCNQI